MPAIPLVAIELAPFLELLFALLLIFAGTLLVGPLVYILQQIPVVGATAADIVASGVASGVDRIRAWAEGPIKGFNDFLGSIVGGATWLINNIESGLIMGITAFILAGQSAIALAQLTYGTVAQITAQVAGLIASLPHVIAQVADVAGKLDNVIRTGIPAAIRAAEAAAALAIARAVTTAETFATHAVTGVQTALTALIRREVADLGHAIDGVSHQLQTDVHSIEAELHGDVSTLTRAIDGKVGALEHELGGLLNPATLAAVLAAPLALTALRELVKTMERECVDPMCGYMKPQLPNLAALSDAAVLGLVIAAAAEAIHDPRGAATAARSVSGAVIGPAGAIMSGLFGVTV